MFDDVRHVDEIVLLLLAAQELPDVVANLMQNHAAGRPVADICFIRDSEICAGKVAISQLEAGGEKPPCAEANVEDARIPICWEIRRILVRSL